MIARGSVPANILLFGEYAVLERGGLGIACAIAPRIEISIAAAAAFTLVGMTGGGQTIIGAERAAAYTAINHEQIDSREERFLALLLTTMLPAIYPRGGGGAAIAELPYRICIDARTCYSTDGQKIGLGSSAATAVGLAAALCYLHDRGQRRRQTEVGTVNPERIFRLALAAHRRARGGGSGYDVAASSFGGTIVFRGGARPHVTPGAPRWIDTPLSLLYGPQAIDSTQAVTRYWSWRRRERTAWRAFIRQSNDLIQRLLTVQTATECAQLIHTSRELQITLGDHIGVSAHFPLPATGSAYPRLAYRTIGAGNELAVVFGATAGGDEQATSRDMAADGSALQIESAGVIWNR